MPDERRFRARLAALDAAARVLDGHSEGPPTDELLVAYATTLEDWLMRPGAAEPAETGTVGPGRQPCGAFLQPSWYTGDRWAVCSGEHVTATEPGSASTLGWHKTAERGAGYTVQIFATHHMVNGSTRLPYGRCACGGQWPCTGDTT